MNRKEVKLRTPPAAIRGFTAFALTLLAAASTSAVANVLTPEQQNRALDAIPQAAADDAGRAHYQIHLKLDFDRRSYDGIERVRWTNADDRPASVLYFHLYANVRARGAQTTTAPAAAIATNIAPGVAVPATSDEPRLDILEVRAAATGALLPFALDDGGVVLRVNLREAIPAGAAAEIEIKFKGSVPEVDLEETTLLAHVVQQVDAALRGEREVRRARDVNYLCRGVMLLGTAYPVLATRDGNDWQRKVETTVGDMVFADAADYDVRIDAPSDVELFTSGMMLEKKPGAPSQLTGDVREFVGEDMRDFAIVASRSLRSEEHVINDVKVRSIFMAEHERVGRRVLSIAAEAVRVYVARFGAMPYKTISIVDAPLVAGLGSAEFTGLCVIASALYVDFDSAQMRNLPEIIREQRASIEDSLEWTVAHVVAQQWWGMVVGSDPERNPVLDESLANWSALVYYKEAHSEERANLALDDQLRGVYRVYRTFGGDDMVATRAAHEYRNSFQYSAIVQSKGALMFAALRRLMGDEKFFASLRSYYKTNMFEIAEMDDLRGAFIAEAPLQQRRAVARAINRWWSGKRGDEDIAPPDSRLAASLGLNPNTAKGGDRNAFARLGKFFWQQMTRIR